MMFISMDVALKYVISIDVALKYVISMDVGLKKDRTVNFAETD